MIFNSNHTMTFPMIFVNIEELPTTSSCSSRPTKPWRASRTFGQVFLKKLPWVLEMEDNKPHGAFAVHA